jgi:16S rRNA (cytidine1402-2'-O)-methyltransferase
MPRAKGGAESGAISQHAGADKPIEGSRRSKLAPGLYLVATPIGNAEDITLRALKVLAGADAVLCEDTRVSGKLLARFNIAAKKIPYHDHNADRVRPGIVARLQAGAALALISDAGTPLVSDPGFKLVRDAIAAGVAVTAVPGASAALAGLSLAGLPPDKFLFAGFLPPKPGARRRALDALKAVPATLIFFESGPRLADSLSDMAAMLGDRAAAVARELTKLFEEVKRGGLAQLAAHYQKTGAPKGEIVVVVAPPAGEVSADANALDAALRAALARVSLRQAVAEIAAETGLPRREVYARALALTGEGR